ncbi:MAG: hypothetical protein ACRD4Q_05565 [Candidatus Acidiferrales bacterium]
MPNRKSIRRLLVPVALLALLVMATTLGGVWHHHDNASSEANCPICHLSHQPIVRPLAGDPAPALAPVGPGPEPRINEFAPGPVVHYVPARAPPFA